MPCTLILLYLYLPTAQEILARYYPVNSRNFGEML
jgi:hypothetical protein